MTDRLKELERACHAAARRLLIALKAECPVGADVMFREYSLSGHEQPGVVVSHDIGSRGSAEVRIRKAEGGRPVRYASVSPSRVRLTATSGGGRA